MEGDEPDILRTFCTAFCTNFKKATLLCIPMIAVALTIVINYVYIIQNLGPTNFIQILVNLCFILWVVTWVYVMPVMAYYENSMAGYLQFSYRLAIAQLPRTIILILANTIPLVILIVLACLSPAASMILVICGFSLPAYWGLKLILPIFARYGEKEYD